MKEQLVIKDEVKEAFEQGKPVVALESTIIAHGMPYPRNIEAALANEGTARSLGVVPATVAILKGRLHIGLSPAQVEYLGSAEEILKVSRRDFSYCLAGGFDGATTVCGTMIAAHLAGIAVFATGGIGGVHRGAAQSWDVSADLLELARTPVIVVSAGAKAILDLPATLEFLETRGVPVLGYKTAEFPAFFSRTSNLKSVLKVDSAAEIARIYLQQRDLKLQQGLLVANPIPAEYEIPAPVIEGYLDRALSELKKSKITGKGVTPFLLSKILEFSEGKTLECNIKLVENNVRLACGIAAGLK